MNIALILALTLLPVVPPGSSELSLKPIAQCGTNWGVYQRVYDTNPDSKAAFAEYGVMEVKGGVLSYDPPIMAVIQGDAGERKIYVKEVNGQITIYDPDAFYEKYTDACDLPGMSPVIKT